MAITQAMCTSFKQELMLGTHNFATNGNSFKLALYAEGGGGKSSTTATLGAATTAYTTTGEVANSGSYTAGGSALTNVAPTTSSTTALTDFADISFTTATITAMGALIYNDTNSHYLINLFAPCNGSRSFLTIVPSPVESYSTPSSNTDCHSLLYSDI